MTDDAINPPATVAELTLRIEQRFDEVKVITEVSSGAPSGPWITLTCGSTRKPKDGARSYVVGADEADACAKFLQEFENSTFGKMSDTLYWRIKPEMTLLKNRGFVIVARCQAE